MWFGMEAVKQENGEASFQRWGTLSFLLSFCHGEEDRHGEGH